MLSELGRTPMLGGNQGSLGDEFGREIGLLPSEQRRQEAHDRERELNLCRSGSAPPTVEGSLSAVGGLLGQGGGPVAFSDVPGNQNGIGNGFASEEELRSDPAYLSYYYSNSHLNPRLPPPLLSKEDWRFAQRLKAGGSSSVLGGIGDRRKVSKPENGRSRSRASMPPGFEFPKVEGEPQIDKGVGDWDSDGLIGLSGLGLGSKQKSLAEIFQSDIGHSTPVSGNPSRPASRNAFEENVENISSPEAELPHLLLEQASTQALWLGANSQSSSVVPDIGQSASYSLATALGTSLSRSTSPDPQLVARVPSPCLTPIGVGRNVSSEKRGVSSPNVFNGVSSGMNEAADLAASMSGMNISTNGGIDDENHLSSHIVQDMDSHRNYFFNMQDARNHTKRHSHLNNSEPGKIHVTSFPDSAKSSYPVLHRNKSSGSDLNYSSRVAERQVGLQKPAFPSGNSFSKRPSVPMLNSGGLHSQYQPADSMNASFPTNGLNGYNINPAMSSVMANHIGTGNLPLFYENVAAASALSVPGMDSRVLGGGLHSGPNYAAVESESQNLSRMANRMIGNAVRAPFVDPMHLQYWRSADYATGLGVSLNDPPVERNYLGNSYVDLLGIQKAYMGSSLSAQKSQYGVPLGVKSSGSNHHGFYGSTPYGVGMSYHGSLLANPIIPNSLVRPGSPIRNNELNTRLPSGIRNLAGVVGSWHLEGHSNVDESFASTLLEEFKSNKAKSFELLEIAGHVVEFSADQYGSRFIQQKLETATMEEKNMVFQEIMPKVLSLMTDVFGNYVIQKFFEHGAASQRRELANELIGHVLTLSLQMYGCRVIQKAIEVVDDDQKIRMVEELDGHVMRCVHDQNGNHVIQKCIECVPEEAIQFIVTTFFNQVVSLSTHPYGCRVIQRILENCKDNETQSKVMVEILGSVSMLAQDQYGNYVVQHVLEHGKPHERSTIIEELAGNIVQMSQQKFASNVVEKCLTFGGPSEREILVNEMLGSTDENEPLQAMMKDQFANYVVQKVLETVNDQQRELILSRIKVHLNALKKYTYGKHIVARVEKLVAAGERRSTLQSSNPA